MKSLAKRLDERYQSVAAMRSDIERYLAGRPVQAPAVAAAPMGVVGATGDHTQVPAPTSNQPAVQPAVASHRQDDEQVRGRSEEHTSELQSLMRNSYAVFSLKIKTNINHLISSSHI